jgi:hypothetical protein
MKGIWFLTVLYHAVSGVSSPDYPAFEKRLQQMSDEAVQYQFLTFTACLQERRRLAGELLKELRAYQVTHPDLHGEFEVTCVLP